MNSNKDPWRHIIGGLFTLAFIAFVLEIVISPGEKTAFVTGAVITAGLLIVIAALPHTTEFSVGVQGVKAKLNELQETVDKQEEQITNLQTTINDMVMYSMSSAIFRHLSGIALLKQYHYHHNEAFSREMYFLRDNGFITGFLDFDALLDGKNLVEQVKLTPIGVSCVKLRKEEARGLLEVDPLNVKDNPFGP